MKYFKYALLFVFSSRALSAMGSKTPEQLIPLLVQALNQNQFRQAAGYVAHFRIRTRLDVACCSDTSTSAVRDILTVMGMTNPKFQELSQQVPKEDMETIFKKEFAAIEHDLENKTLSSPHWVAQYGMNQFGISTSDQPLFPSDEECHTIRKNVLGEYKKQMPFLASKPTDSCVLL